MWLLEVFNHFIICKSCRYCFFCDTHVDLFWWVFSFQKVTPNSIVLTVSDGSLLSLMAARLGAKQVSLHGS